MNKYISAVTIVLMLFVLASCMPPTRMPPEGIWHSEDPNVTLYLKPEYEFIHFGPLTPGHFVMNDEILKVAVRFGPADLVNMFYDVRIDERGIRWSPPILLAGRWRMRGDKVRLALNPSSREKLGTRAIVFAKIEEYDPIDPADWIIDERVETELE